MGVHPKVGRMSILLLVAAAAALIGAGLTLAHGHADRSVKAPVTDGGIVRLRTTALRMTTPGRTVIVSMRSHDQRVRDIRVGGRTAKAVLIVFKTAKSYAFPSILPSGVYAATHGS